MKKIAVILSTYNGEKYLKEQMDSLLYQKNVDITLFVRDDGSTDKTVEIIQSYLEHMNIFLFKESNIGFERSFRNAVLKTENKHFDFYAFCDQDDIWYENKLIQGIQFIESHATNNPVLYCSNQQIIDEQGLVVRNEKDKIYSITKESSLFALNQRGCVMIWNNKLHEHLKVSYKMMNPAEFIPAHDTWITMLAYALGDVYIDNSRTMGYRVSTHNTAGSYIGLIGRIHYILKKLSIIYNNRKYQRTQLAQLLLLYLNKIPDGDSDYISVFLKSQESLLKSGCFILSSSQYFQGMTKKWRWLIKVLILFRRI
ncbi:glycosyltransferase [Streptococcus suis]|nr:glycosyltransferase [Streptococcus suis]